MQQPLDEPTIQRFRGASRIVVRELDLLRDVYGRTGASPGECHLLVEVEADPTLTPSQLAARLRLDATATSRLIRRLQERRWLTTAREAGDARRKTLRLTAAGRREVARIHREANDRVRASLEQLRPDDAHTVLRGMELYAKALERAQAREGFLIRPIAPEDDPAVASLIRTVMPEFGADRPGFAYWDAEVDAMCAAYDTPRSTFFVLTRRGKVVGGAGIAPLKGGKRDTCELRKMYFLRDARGRGLGQLLLERCLEAARELGFRYCYLETLELMTAARRMYERNGFEPLPKPLGDTGHYTCDAWYLLDLKRAPVTPAGR